jgi:hypothetical protein
MMDSARSLTMGTFGNSSGKLMVRLRLWKPSASVNSVALSSLAA